MVQQLIFRIHRIDCKMLLDTVVVSNEYVPQWKKEWEPKSTRGAIIIAEWFRDIQQYKGHAIVLFKSGMHQDLCLKDFSEVKLQTILNRLQVAKTQEEWFKAFEL